MHLVPELDFQYCGKRGKRIEKKWIFYLENLYRRQWSWKKGSLDLALCFLLAATWRFSSCITKIVKRNKTKTRQQFTHTTANAGCIATYKMLKLTTLKFCIFYRLESLLRLVLERIEWSPPLQTNCNNKVYRSDGWLSLIELIYPAS